MYPRFKDYFYFNRSERKGIIALIIIIVLILTAKHCLIYLDLTPNYSNSNLDSLVSQVQNQIDSIQKVKENKKTHDYSLALDSINFFDFDPNGFPEEGWQKFGLTEKQAEVIKRYEVSGGKFVSKRDVKKMFVISDEMFLKLEPHILLPDSIVYDRKSKPQWKQDSWKEKNHQYTNKYKKREFPKININTADTAEFKKLYGIGSVLSQRIVEYRNNLGGFYSKNQLNEIYGLQPELLEKLDSQLVFQPIELKKININLSTADELKEHPLINWRIANSIIKYREQHGYYKSIEEIKNSHLIDDQLFERTQMYLTVE